MTERKFPIILTMKPHFTSNCMEHTTFSALTKTITIEEDANTDSVLAKSIQNRKPKEAFVKCGIINMLWNTVQTVDKRQEGLFIKILWPESCHGKSG